MVKKIKEPEKTDAEILADLTANWVERVAHAFYIYASQPGFNLHDYKTRPNIYEFVSRVNAREFEHSQDLDITIPTDPNSQWFYALENIESEIAEHFAELERQKNFREARATALAKLTNEDRKLLGLL